MKQVNTYEIKITVEGPSPEEAWDDFLNQVACWKEGYSGFYKPEYGQATQVSGGETDE